MSRADELLATLADDGDFAYPINSDDEAHIVIEPDRTITVPESLRRIAVQYDHNIETVTFDCPRYWDEHDMSTMPMYINYLLPNGKTGIYAVDTVRVDETDPSIMHFDWTISSYVTQTPGYISFLVCVKKVDIETAEITNHWNSELCSQLYISEGMECVQEHILPQVDIITQLLALVPEMREAVGKINHQVTRADVTDGSLANELVVAKPDGIEATTLNAAIADLYNRKLYLHYVFLYDGGGGYLEIKFNVYSKHARLFANAYADNYDSDLGEYGTPIQDDIFENMPLNVPIVASGITEFGNEKVTCISFRRDAQTQKVSARIMTESGNEDNVYISVIGEATDVAVEIL